MNFGAHNVFIVMIFFTFDPSKNRNVPLKYHLINYED